MLSGRSGCGTLTRYVAPPFKSKAYGFEFAFYILASVTSLALTFVHSEKSQAALVLLPFLSKLNPLRWVSILFNYDSYAQTLYENPRQKSPKIFGF